MITVTREELLQKIRNNEDLSQLDVSGITDMSFMFCLGKYGVPNKVYSDISGWDVSNVTDMSFMFYGAECNVDLSKWNTSSLQNLKFAISNTDLFTSDISGWDVSNVILADGLFVDTNYSADLRSWDLSKCIAFHRFGESSSVILNEKTLLQIEDYKNYISSLNFGNVNKYIYCGFINIFDEENNVYRISKTLDLKNIKFTVSLPQEVIQQINSHPNLLNISEDETHYILENVVEEWLDTKISKTMAKKTKDDIINNICNDFNCHNVGDNYYEITRVNRGVIKLIDLKMIFIKYTTFELK